MTQKKELSVENNRKLAIRGIVLMLLGLVFAIIETSYFGSNYWPESTAEWICDILSLVVSMTGGVMLLTATYRQAKQYIEDFKKKNNIN